MINDTNNTIIVGLLIKKERNADNIDIQRPILDFEIVISSNNPENESDIIFEEIPALLSDNAMARSSAGFYVGDIFIIVGKIHNDDKQYIYPKKEHYIEVNNLIKIYERKKSKTKRQSLLESRVDLIKYSKALNRTIIQGTVIKNDTGYVEIKINRPNYTRGDLNDEDTILVITDKAYKIGTIIMCIGQICSSYMKPSTIITCD